MGKTKLKERTRITVVLLAIVSFMAFLLSAYSFLLILNGYLANGSALSPPFYLIQEFVVVLFFLLVFITLCFVYLETKVQPSIVDKSRTSTDV
jgi:hypothetical protein